MLAIPDQNFASGIVSSTSYTCPIAALTCAVEIDWLRKEDIQMEHIAEPIQYRSEEREGWMGGDILGFAVGVWV